MGATPPGTFARPSEQRERFPRRAGAIGKALLVWLVSGSFGVAVIAFIIFAMMGC